MKIDYIDIHGHVNFPEYDTDREDVIRRAHDAGVAMISVGTGLESSKQALDLTVSHDHMWAVVGIHPADVHGDVSAVEFEGVAGLATYLKVVAIGECGLDYFHATPEDIPRQRELFVQHIQLANDVQKPLMLHVRNGKTGSHNAYQEAIEVLKKYAKVPANFHFFAGTPQDAQDIVAMGNTISFTGVVTFARNYDEVIRGIPLANIMSETDCPYVAPVPHRGTRCEPVHVIETVNKIAEIRGEPADVVAAQLIKNAQQFFKLV